MSVINSLVKYGGKELAKKAIGNEIVGATSDLATKAASSVLNKILVKQAPSVAQKISVSAPEMVTLYRGINAETPELLQKYLKDMKDNSILPRTYSGNALNGNGYTHSTDLATAREYANDGVLNGKPYGAVTKIEVPKNRFLKMNYENGKSENNFIENATLRGIDNAEEIGKQNFHNVLSKNGIYGSHNLENQYTIMNNDAMRDMSTIEKYANGDLLTDTQLPVGSKVKFDKDLNISSIAKPAQGRGWFATNENNPHISKMVKDTGADAYLGTPKIVYHGSPTTGIEDFDINMAGKNTQSGERAQAMTTQKSLRKHSMTLRARYCR